MLVLALVFVLKPPYPHTSAAPIKKQVEVSTAKAEPIAVQPTPPPQPQQATEQVQVQPVQPPPVTPVTNCGSDPYMAQIYTHESGCRSNAINASSGACGIGQALPCGKLPCSLSDWACQDQWFRQYAVARYGSTAAAWAFWQSHRWW